MPAEDGNDRSPPHAYPVCEMRLLLASRLDELARLQGFIEDFSEKTGLKSDFRHAFDLALTEWITNVISYGLPPGAQDQIELILAGTGSEIQAEVVDSGRPFDPLKHPTVDVSVPLEDKPIGGLGIHMIRQLMDRVAYRRENGKNRLSMVKRVPARTDGTVR